MKITSVDVYVLKTPLEEPFAFSQGWVRQRSATLVRIQTDNGLSGWGEAFAPVSYTHLTLPTKA